MQLQRSVDEHVGHAWEEPFLPTLKTVDSSSATGLVTMSPLDHTPIVWKYPEKGVRELDLFGGINVLEGSTLDWLLCYMQVYLCNNISMWRRMK